MPHISRKISVRYLTRIWALLLVLIPSLSKLFATAESSSTAETLSEANEHHPTADNHQQQPSSSFLLLCLTDGSIYTMDAWTGRLASQVAMEPLLQKNRAAKTERNHRVATDDHDDEMVQAGSEQQQTVEEEPRTTAIVPGLDGRLYSYSESRHGDDDGTSSNHPPVLEALPITIQSILEHPVRSCASLDDPRDCGIITATAQTTLLALDESGHLLWKSRDGSFSAATSSPTWNHADDSTSSSSPIVSPLLLQRKDYWVQHVSSVTGRQAWNVSLGSYQALDFTTSLDDDEDNEEGTKSIPLDLHHLPDQEVFTTKRPALPAISFSNAGRTLTAVDPDSGAILWKQTTPSVLASVFGIQSGHWKPLTVLDGEDDQPFPVLEQNEEGLKYAVTRHRLNGGSEQQSDTLGDYWTQVALEAAQAAHKRQAASSSSLSQRQQKLLPGRQQQQQHQTAVCLLGNCPAFMNPPRKYLGLPSPEDYDTSLSNKRGNVNAVRVDGLLLSWELVAVLLTSLLLLLVGVRQWYLSKKKKWLDEPHTNSEPSKTWHPAVSLREPAILSSKQRFRRSISLPGVLKSLPSHLTTTSEPGAVELTSNNKSRAEPVLDEAKEEEEVVIHHQAGIPLVRYSRYASEFEEMEAMGKGGFGTVFRCRNVLDGGEYAVKKVLINGATSDKSFQRRLQRVLREVKILAVLEHAHIVRYYTAWLEMEKVEDIVRDSPSRSGTDNKYGDESTGMSRCYSSSLLLTDSVSQWDTDLPLSNHRRLRPPYPPTENSLGWNNDFRIPEESPSSLRRNLLHDDESDGIFFQEDSKIDVEHSGGGTGMATEEAKNESREMVVTHETRASQNRLQKDTMRHTLYIQMQLCSQHTVADFLMDETARRGNAASGVDIPIALQLFFQIAQAVQYVHDQGLIHRDLKPSNCFMDVSGNIKVGDFGLSRESGVDSEASVLEESMSHAHNDNDDHTAGVGTRSYASPEQSNGSDYDASTDVYSLGIVLFELCYLMYTGMERNICLSRLRDLTFPKDWLDVVGATFPTLKGLICSMLNKTPSRRPTAKSVAEAVQSILGEFTIISLDNKHGPEMILLRIEADHREDTLGHTMELIRQAAEQEGEGAYKIVQYGLRSASSGERPAAIMEFAVQSPDPKRQGPKLVSILSKMPDIRKVRQISRTIPNSN